MDDNRKLLSEVSANMQSKELLPYVPLSKYNMFDILEVASKEVVMCRFLADLLNPEGAHGYGILFLKSFLQKVLKEQRINDTLLTHTNVIKEFVIDYNRRIDIVIQNARFEKSSLQMWFRIEVEHNLFAGFSLFDTEAKPQDESKKGYQVDCITKELINEVAQYLNEDIIMPEGWWFTWCYSNGKRQVGDYADVPNFKEMNQCAICLVDKLQRKKFVKNAVKNFEEYLLQYLLG